MIRNRFTALKEKLSNAGEDRGQVGIGTLIVFIAMVLVAAIAAGVLINTAGFLQTKSEQTGQESSAQVSNRVQVVSGFGDVMSADDASGNSNVVDEISLTVMRGSGSDDINLSAATIEWIGPNDAETLTYHEEDLDKDTFTVSPIKDSDESEPVLNDQDDRFEVTMSANEIGGESVDGLAEGESVELKLTTQYGAVTIYRANIPQSLSKDSAVTV